MHFLFFFGIIWLQLTSGTLTRKDNGKGGITYAIAKETRNVKVNILAFCSEHYGLWIMDCIHFYFDFRLNIFRMI